MESLAGYHLRFVRIAAANFQYQCSHPLSKRNRKLTTLSATMDLSTFIPLAKFIAIVWPTLYAGTTLQCAPATHQKTSD